MWFSPPVAAGSSPPPAPVEHPAAPGLAADPRAPPECPGADGRWPRPCRPASHAGSIPGTGAARRAATGRCPEKHRASNWERHFPSPACNATVALVVRLSTKNRSTVPVDVLHQPGHVARMAGQQTAHVVIDAAACGTAARSCCNVRTNSCCVMSRRQAAAIQWPVLIHGLHRQMQHHFLAAGYGPAPPGDPRYAAP